MEYKETYEKFWEVAENHTFEQYPRNWILPYFFPPTTGHEKVADVAGGAGIVSQWLICQGYEPYLIEFSDIAVARAKEKGLSHISQIMIEGLGSTPYEDSFFEAVFFGDIIEHLFDSESALKEMKRILKPGGKLIISCPNIAYWRFRLHYLLEGDLQNVDVAKQKPWEQEHIRFFTAPILKEYLALLRFKYVKHAGVNNVWHSKWLASKFPHLFAHTIVVEFINNK